jgi:hypothetical protein
MLEHSKVKDTSHITEASFVVIERTVEFRLLERDTMPLDDLTGTRFHVHH